MKGTWKGKAPKQEISSKTRRRNFGATVPMRFASSKLQKTENYVRNSNAEQPSRSHSNAICKHQVAEADGTKFARHKLLLAKTCSKTRSRRQSKKKVYDLEPLQ